MKLFILGSSGLVGGAFAELASRQAHTVIGTVTTFAGTPAGVSEKITLDLTDEAAVTAAILRTKPDAILNAAAVSEPAKCDEDLALSQKLNVALPALAARLAQQLSARFIHLSSEQVFAGDRAPYAVTDPVAPINTYARQKVESEKLVHAAAPTLTATVRAPLLMGNSPGGKRSLHERLLADWTAGKTPALYTDEFRQTCTAQNLAAALLELCERREITGIFQWAGAELLSRLELGVRIRDHFGIPESASPLKATDRAANPKAAAVRQANLALDLRPLSQLLKTPVETFAQQLAVLTVPSHLRVWHEAAAQKS
ncbi:MAG: sugar nucleotide-binding protein [Nibricoccus sp.]